MNDHLDPLILDAYLEDSLSLSERQQAEEHLSRCSVCQEHRARLQELTALARRLPIEPASPLLAMRINQVVERKRRVIATGYRPGLAYWAVACGLIGAFLVGTTWTQLSSLITRVPSISDTSLWQAVISAFLAEPSNAVTEVVNTGLTWQNVLSDGMDIALLVGLVLLSLAIFGGLVEMLVPKEPVTKRTEMVPDGH
jgi:anti-sigma factor RsiW